MMCTCRTMYLRTHIQDICTVEGNVKRTCSTRGDLLMPFQGNLYFQAMDINVCLQCGLTQLIKDPQ